MLLLTDLRKKIDWNKYVKIDVKHYFKQCSAQLNPAFHIREKD